MPRRRTRRAGTSRITANARYLRNLRNAESDEQAAVRRRINAERNARSRECEDPHHRLERLAAQKLRSRNSRARKTQQQTQERLAAQNVRSQNARAQETQEQTQARLIVQNLRNCHAISHETQQQRDHRLSYMRNQYLIRLKKKWDSMKEMAFHYDPESPVLESSANSSEDRIYNYGLNDTLPSNCGEAQLQLIVPDLLPGRMKHIVGKTYSELDSDEGSDENVDSKVGVFCDTLPNVCDDEMEHQLITPDVFPGRTQEVIDKIHSGLKSEENVNEDLDTEIDRISEFELEDTKPCIVGLESQRIDPDALRGRMQQMVDKIRTGLTGLCSGASTTPTCVQSPGSSTSTKDSVHSQLDSDEISNENVDSKITIFCDTLPNVCDDEMQHQLIMPDFFPGRTQEVVDQIHSGQESEENVSEDLDTKIDRISELELEDIKPCIAEMESQRIDPDALRGRMQQMVDKIRTGLTGLCPGPSTTATCDQSPGSSTSTKDSVHSRRSSKQRTEHFRNKRLYLCRYCHKVFINRAERQNHMLTHGEKTEDSGQTKLFSCLDCGKKYKRYSNLYKHKYICHV